MYFGKSDPFFWNSPVLEGTRILIRQECESSNYAKGEKEDATKYTGPKNPFGIQRPENNVNEVEKWENGVKCASDG